MRHHLRIAAALVVPLTLAGLGGVSWHLSSIAMAPTGPISYNLEILRVDATKVTFERTSQTMRSGLYGLIWPSGNAIVGPVVDSNEATVTRALQSSSVPLQPAQRVKWSDEVWVSDPKSARSIDFENVVVPSPIGGFPAWFVPGESKTWVIVIHGRGVDRTSTLRVLPALQATNNPVLVVTHRNDAGAPQADAGRHHFGASEWRDIDAAVSYARQQGADHVVLYGGSAGGALAAQTLHESQSAHMISGLILDSPVLDWQSVIEYQASKRSVPLPVTKLAEQFLSWRTGLDYSKFDQVARAEDFRVPVLLLVGDSDTTVPTGPAHAFAAARPDLITFEVFPGAGHAQNWNVDAPRYDAALTSFLNRVTEAK